MKGVLVSHWRMQLDARRTREVYAYGNDSEHALTTRREAVRHTVLDHSVGQDRSVGHSNFLTLLLLNLHQIEYMISSTTY
jgi:hypothetical protein